MQRAYNERVFAPKGPLMNAFRRLALAAAALVPLSPSLAQTGPPGPPVVGCGIVTDPPVAPQIRLQTPPFRPGVVARQGGRGGSAGGGTVVVPGDPGSPLPPELACAADIGAVIAGDAIAPGRIGLAMNLLGDGFHLTFLSLGSDCSVDVGSSQPVPVLQTSWSVDGTTLPLQLSQQPQADPAGNRIDDGSASFWWQGYLYTLAMPAAMPARAGTEVAAADDSRQILLQAIAELAPALDVDCFAQRKTGAWADLAVLGIGDPRPAIPQGYSAADFQLTYLSAPSCASPAPSHAEVSFYATFQSAGGGWIGIGAWSLAGSAPYPGTVQDGLVAWSSDRYQFTVYGGGSDGNAASATTLLPIARALDPAFSADCVLQPVVLSPADLPGLGFHAPSAPDGWVLTSSSLTGEVVGVSCSRPFDFRGTYSLFWSFSSSEGLTIAASAYRVVSDHPGPRTAPVVSDSCISWSDDRGTTFSVSGYSASGAAGPDRSVLVAMARSMDPGLTISN